MPKKPAKKSTTKKATVLAAPPVSSEPKVSSAQQTYETVQKLVTENKLSKADAFKQISKDTGRSTGAVSQSYYFQAAKQGGGAVTKRGKRGGARKGKAAPARKPTPTTSKAQQTFAAVQQLVKDKGVSKSEAFKRVAKDTKRTATTIATTYYLYARKQHGSTPLARGGRKAGSGSIDAALAGMDKALKVLAMAVKDQSAELARMKAEAAWAERVRLAVGKR